MKDGVFLVYRPVLQYEESMEPFVVCDTPEDAQAVVDKVMSYANRLIERLPQYPPDDEPDEDGSKWTAADDKREALVKRLRWPFGIDLRHDVCHKERGETVSGLLEIMFVPRVP